MTSFRTPLCASIDVYLIVAGAVMADEFNGLGEVRNELSIESACNLRGILLAALYQEGSEYTNFNGIVGSGNGNNAIIFASITVLDKLLSVPTLDLLQN